MTHTGQAIIFDSGSLISFSMNGVTDLVRELKKIFNGKFLITREVYHEIVTKPIKVKRFELEALKLKALVDEKILEYPSVLGIKDNEITVGANRFLKIANATFYGRKRYVKIMDRGEASCLALSSILNKKKIKNVLAIDERTTRMLAEKPENLKSLFQKKMNTQITLKQENFKFFKEFKVVRSAELAYVAYKKGVTKLKGPQVLDALLYAMKFKGAAISGEEIEQIKKIG